MARKTKKQEREEQAEHAAINATLRPNDYLSQFEAIPRMYRYYLWRLFRDLKYRGMPVLCFERFSTGDCGEDCQSPACAKAEALDTLAEWFGPFTPDLHDFEEVCELACIEPGPVKKKLLELE